MKHKAFPIREFKAVDETQGIFEAIVAVFNNVDRAGDKIIPGAFDKSLQRWSEKGRPIPVIFSHDWANLDAHIGQVMEAEEQDFGLYVKAQLDMDEDFAARVWKKMSRGTLAEFSFAYDVLDSKFVKGVNELRELDLLEVGPCLVGMNPETQLLGVKVEQKPYPNEHACRLRDPGDFEDGSFRRIQREHEGKEYSVIMGRLSGEDTMTQQAFRYPSDTWEADEARSHCGAAEGTFEEASDGEEGKILGVLQQMHDLTVELGAKCGHEETGEGEGEGEDQGKGTSPAGDDITLRVSKPSTLAARVALELLQLGIGGQQ